MNAFLLALFYTSGILLCGNGLPYGDLFSKYEANDDYYEDYYLKKIPKLRTSPDKVKEFILNHLSWFPVDDLEYERRGDRSSNQLKSDESWDDVIVQTSTDNSKNTASPTCTHKIKSQNITKTIRRKVSSKVKNFTVNHHIPTSWNSVKNQSSKSMHKMKNFLHKKHLKETMINATHPLRYRGHANHTKNGKHQDECGCKYTGPSVRIHPKSSHVEVIKNSPESATTTTTTTAVPFTPCSKSAYLDSHFSIPRKIKVIIDLKTSEKPSKSERRVDEKSFGSAEGDNNSTNVLGTAGEMASDLAEKVTNLWHCVVGQHRLPNLKDVRFYLYTRRNIIQPELLKVNYNLIQKKVRENPKHMDIACIDLPPEEIGDFERISDANREIIKSNFLNLRAPTKILIHGYTGSYKDNRMAQIKDAYLTNGRYNVIQVDWEMLAAPPCYIKVTHHSKFVGETIAHLLNGLHLVGLNMSLVHLVGFSLGAQVAGFTGNNATIAPVCRITGLDPALPLFLHTEPAGHLDKLDAKFVDVIHTCGGILAMLDPIGHVDFYPNGGTRQPGCEFSNLKCSHSRAPQYFAESIISHKKFTGQLCLSWDEYVAGECNNVTDISYMGEPCSRKSVTGKYYLMTKSKEPFVL